MSELYKRIKDVSNCVKSTVYNLQYELNKEEREIANIRALNMPEEFKKTLLTEHLKKLQELRCKLNDVIDHSCSQDHSCPKPMATHHFTEDLKLKF
jgi:hypothetical protein